MDENFINKDLIFTIEDSSSIFKNYGYNDKDVFIFSFTVMGKNLANKFSNYLAFIYSPTIFNNVSILLFIFATLFFFQTPNIKMENVNFLLAYILIVFISFFHEIGHGSACKYSNINHGRIGFGLYVFYFVFFIDVTESWRLERKNRILVNIGGMYFQSIATMILFVFSFFYYSDTLLFTCLLSFFNILYTLNPFFKFDGYWIIVDSFGISNLRKFSSNYIKNIFKSESNEKKIISQLSSKQRWFFYLYMTISNLFFGAVLIILISKLPAIFTSLYSMYTAIIKEPNDSFEIFFTEGHLLTSLFANLLTLMALFLIIKRFIPQIFKSKQ